MAHNDTMDFPKTFKEFLNEYSFIDNEEIYTNKSELIQTFRVEQGYEHFEKIIRADERRKTLYELENKIRIWDNNVKAIPNYVWKCIKEMKGNTEK